MGVHLDTTVFHKFRKGTARLQCKVNEYCQQEYSARETISGQQGQIVVNKGIVRKECEKEAFLTSNWHRLESRQAHHGQRRFIAFSALSSNSLFQQWLALSCCHHQLTLLFAKNENSRNSVGLPKWAGSSSCVSPLSSSSTWSNGQGKGSWKWEPGMRPAEACSDEDIKRSTSVVMHNNVKARTCSPSDPDPAPGTVCMARQGQRKTHDHVVTQWPVTS
eukprot:1141743-Pelagomonas_calceolata.AAC.2